MAQIEPAGVELLVLDVDGVLTDGSIVYDDAGRELKAFNIRDGFGLTLWRRAGFEAAILTGRGGGAVVRRARELGIRVIVEGSADKAAGLAEIAARSGVEPGRMAYMGDDWPDLPAMRLAGYPMAPADAEGAVREAAAFVSGRAGGHGAVRDAVEHLLGAKGLLEGLLGSFTG